MFWFWLFFVFAFAGFFTWLQNRQEERMRQAVDEHNRIMRRLAYEAEYREYWKAAVSPLDIERGPH